MKRDLNLEQSKLIWHASKVAGKHHGSIKIQSGWVDISDDGLLSGAEIVADMTTIQDEDLTNARLKKTLTDHLRSADFFDAENFPQSTLVIKNVRSSETETAIVADLTMRGKTNEIEYNATIKREGNTWVADGTATVDRTRWDIKFRSGKFFSGLGDALIHDEFSIEFHLVTA